MAKVAEARRTRGSNCEEDRTLDRNQEYSATSAAAGSTGGRPRRRTRAKKELCNLYSVSGCPRPRRRELRVLGACGGRRTVRAEDPEPECHGGGDRRR